MRSREYLTNTSNKSICFWKKVTTKTLLKHQIWNHEIILELSKTFTFEFIYALFEKKLKILREYLNENLTKKFIRKSQSSTKYSILFVFKKNKKLRLCIDYRKLNEITIKNRHSLLKINEFQNHLLKAKYFIKLDLRETYNLIRMKTRKKWKIIFRTRYEHYEYTIISFEFINVSTIYQEMINNALREHLNVFVIAYLDDILIYFKTLLKHKQHVQTMLQCLRQRKLLFKSKKCEFH